MAVTCTTCNAETYQAVDEEKDVKGRTFVLLECRQCHRTIIVPQAQWQPQSASPGRP